MLKKLILVSSLLMTPATLSFTLLPVSVLTSKELKCLTDNVYHEARGETFKGMILVARTTLNRAKHPKFPRKVCDVVYQPYQFSWTLNKQKITDRESWNRAANAVFAALTHQSPALYFHATYVQPTWAKHKQRLEKEGNHIFYK